MPRQHSSVTTLRRTRSPVTPKAKAGLLAGKTFVLTGTHFTPCHLLNAVRVSESWFLRGWPDLIPQSQCEFLLDYEDEEDAAEETGRRRKKPWRHRWPDLVRDEVLARLLKLNSERAEQERLAGLAAVGKKKPNNPRAKTPSAAPPQSEILPGPQSDLFV
ncbi:MAG: hypothetical protein NT167_30655 [Verrucomicrobia bacterium]|nr:hypothetical protein [Verrucomicrobiota bacterium]